ncbi:MAG: hypothetical protein UV98_C0016G0003 [Parcubacteria group bacterium GW2011_GWB1_43_6]|nr:MAG: hypothetical protein UV98_C0016G0003 [Parcubacteria group bacterium GW2011_GWB1_43_6]
MPKEEEKKEVAMEKKTHDAGRNDQILTVVWHHYFGASGQADSFI